MAETGTTSTGTTSTGTTSTGTGRAGTVDDFPAGMRVLGYGDGPAATELAAAELGAAELAAAEPGAAGAAGEPDAGRRNSWWFFWTWLVTPHIEFGAVYLGMVVVLFLHMSVLQALIGVFFGVAFGALSHGILTARGTRLRVPQVVLGRLAFGATGNAVITTVMAVISSAGWFIVNSVVAGLAINALFGGVPVVAGLAIAVIAQWLLAQVGISYRKVQQYLYPVLTVILLVAGLVTFTKVDLAADRGSPWDLNGLIAVVVVACLAWAYTIGWNPYATDYSARTPSGASPRQAGLFSGFGLFVATMFLMSVGVAAGVVIDGVPALLGETNPTAQFTGYLPTVLATLVLLALIAGSFTTNAITLKSARPVFRVDRLGISAEVGRHLGPVALTVVAFFLGWWATTDLPANFQGFVMVLGVWIAPWLNVSLVDYLLRRKDDDPTPYLYQPTAFNKWGVLSIAFALAASILIWGIQIVNGGKMGGPNVHGVSYAALGMLAGFYLSAVIYSMGMKKVFREKAGQPLDAGHHHRGRHRDAH